MKNFILLFLSIISASIASGNKIDSLNTIADVNKFYHEKIDTSSKEPALLLDKNKDKYSLYGNNTFYKVDIDGNGLTDLIIDGFPRTIILDRGDNKFEV